jgi:hypothetical protein
MRGVLPLVLFAATFVQHGKAKDGGILQEAEALLPYMQSVCR